MSAMVLAVHDHLEQGLGEGWVLAFDVEDAWNGVETWVARLDQGSAYIATSGVI